MHSDEAVSLKDISLEITKFDDVKVDESSWKDEKIKKLEEQLKHKDNLMGYYKKEVKTQVFTNRRLKKTLVNTDNFLGDLCGKIQIDHNEKNDVINTLKMEVEAKDILVKELNEEFAKKDWANINAYETNRKELDEIKDLIAQKDMIISEQLVKIIAKDDEIEKNNERINVLETKVYEHDIEKNALEEDITQLEIQNAEKKKNKFFGLLSNPFKSSSGDHNNNNKSLRKTIKGFFTRKSSSRTQSTTEDDVNDFDVQQTSQ